MRVEIIIADSPRADLKANVASLIKRLGKEPLIEKIQVIGDKEDEAFQRMFTPEPLAEIDAVGAEIKAGKGRSLQQVRERLAATEEEWLAANPS